MRTIRAVRANNESEILLPIDGRREGQILTDPEARFLADTLL